MKIILIGPVYPYRGGISHYTTQLATKLEEKGNSVLVVSFSRQYPAWLYPGETDKDPSAQAVKFPAKFILDPLYPWTWFRATKEIMAFNPDVVLLMWWTTFWFLAYAFLSRCLDLKGISVTYLIHNVTPHESKFFDRWATKIALSAAKSFIVQTHEQDKRLKDLMPKAMSDICAHPIYDFFGSRLSREDACNQLQIDGSRKILLFFGIVRPYKGLVYLLEAVSLLKKWGHQVLLLVAGEFWDPKEKYLRLINDCGIQDQVIILDRYIANEEVPALFSATDIFVAPYIGGTQSGVINIARAFGTSIVMTEVIAESAGLQNQSNVPVKDSYALAKAIQNELELPVLRECFENQDDKTWDALIQVIYKHAKEVQPL